VAAQIEGLTAPATKRRRKTTGTRPPADEALAARLSRIVVNTLDRSLGEPTAAGKALRMALIAKLATVEVRSPDARAPIPVSTNASPNDALLTTAQAADRLEVSRPYVSMLCDAGYLGDVVMTEGGHRRIRTSAVDSYRVSRSRPQNGVPTPRQAGIDAGLYDAPDGHFRNKVREALAASPSMPRKT
jgi:excisionase family DNA binding protein